MRSFYFKNFVAAAALTMLAFIMLGAAFVLVGRNYTLRERQTTIESNAEELSRLASAYVQDGELDDWSFRIAMSAIASSTGNHCFITTTDGTIMICAERAPRCVHLGTQVPENIRLSLESDQRFSGVTTLGGLYDEPRYAAALPVTSSTGRILAYAFAASTYTNVTQVWQKLLDAFLIVSFTILVIVLILSYVLSKYRARPINDMSAAAVKFAHGDFSARVTADRDDELGTLAASFNQMAEALEQSERRRREFVANVAHELKTPMTTISGFADGILDGTIPPEQEKKYLRTISSETKRLNRLVRSMLDLSRMQSEGVETLRQRSFDITDALAQTLVLFESKINAKHLEVAALLPEDPILVCGDADAITQVIYNLLENAVKFADPSSELGVSLFKQGERAYVSVRNHGPTIPPEELPLLFDRFHKADKSRSADRDGYGLGLYIVKTILNNHGEDIVVTSRDGVTEFTFSLTLKQK